jgi:hypothetical protein
VLRGVSYGGRWCRNRKPIESCTIQVQKDCVYLEYLNISRDMRERKADWGGGGGIVKATSDRKNIPHKKHLE